MDKDNVIFNAYSGFAQVISMDVPEDDSIVIEGTLYCE